MLINDFDLKTLFQSTRTELKKEMWCKNPKVDVDNAMRFLNDLFKDYVFMDPEYGYLYTDWSIKQYRRRIVNHERDTYYYIQRRSFEISFSSSKLQGLKSVSEIKAFLKQKMEDCSDIHKEVIKHILSKKSWINLKDLK
jgi:hypothetical protein